MPSAHISSEYQSGRIALGTVRVMPSGEKGDMAATYDEQKFKELILYISGRCKGDSAFGAVKLNKLLFFADFLTYAHLGESITGADYIKLPHGPSPKMMGPVRAEMEAHRIAIVQKVSHHGYAQDRLVPRREANLDLFTEYEVAIIDEVVDMFRSDNATQLSDLTHHFPGWTAAAPREVIPYEAIFLSDEEVTDDDRQWASSRASERGW